MPYFDLDDAVSLSMQATVITEGQMMHHSLNKVYVAVLKYMVWMEATVAALETLRGHQMKLWTSFQCRNC